MSEPYDTIIVGGGAAGLSAALVLGRCCRRVLLCDAGHPRNLCSHALHGFLTRDGMEPYELYRIGREQLRPYRVEFRSAEVKMACAHDGGFKVTLAEGDELFTRKVLLATGVKDRIPELNGIEEFYGKSIHHCPYCDGWEWRDCPVAVYGRKQHGYSLALSLKTWSHDVLLFSGGPSRLTPKQREDLALFGIPVREERILRLEGHQGRLERILLETGEAVPRSALFFSTGQEQRCDLAQNFGCIFTNKGAVKTNLRAETNVPGVYVAGDSSYDAQFVVVAAAEGAKAAEAINEALQDEDRDRIRKTQQERR